MEDTGDELKNTDTKPTKNNQDVLYTVNETPPWHECFLLGFQHYLSMFVATLAIPNVLAPGLCLGEDNVAKAEITGTLFFVSGFITILQALFGIRLPIVQGGTFALMSPTLSYLSLPKLTCPEIINDLSQNITANSSAVYLGSDEHREVWQSRLRTIQGSMMVASLVEILLGFSGLVGFLLRFIGPLTICCTLSLLGISLSTSAADMAAKQWWICLATVLLMIIFSQYLNRINVPCFVYSKKDNGCTAKSYPVFKMFPVVLGMGVMWLICYILTLTNVLPASPDSWGYGARTDIRSESLAKSPWVRFPYPGQWGMPNVDLVLVLGLFAGFLSSIVESVGDYHACARLAGAPPPPKHAINRGIGIEGIGCFLAGLFGTGNGTTSTSINVGVIGLTKVGSRAVVLYTAGFMVILAVFNKFGALFVTVPDPIIGGTFFLLFGMIVAVGISNLQYVDMNSSRNLFVFGFSFFLGVTVPQWVSANPKAIQTGVEVLDNSLNLLLKTNMFVGGVTAFIFDNTIPGTRKERGMAEMNENSSGDGSEDVTSMMTYDIPWCSSRLRQSSVSRYIPFCPGFGQRRIEKTAPVLEKIEIGTVDTIPKADNDTDNRIHSISL